MFKKNISKPTLKMNIENKNNLVKSTVEMNFNNKKPLSTISSFPLKMNITKNNNLNQNLELKKEQQEREQREREQREREQREREQREREQSEREQREREQREREQSEREQREREQSEREQREREQREREQSEREQREIDLKNIIEQKNKDQLEREKKIKIEKNNKEQRNKEQREKEQIEKKFSIIHPTKTGGTFLENFFKKKFSKYIINYKNTHDIVCSNDNNPIIIIREPVSRFKSIYKYWKYGSEKYKRKKDFNEKFNSYTIKDFINLIKINDKKSLYRDYFWDKHTEKQTYWIKPNVYKNTIIITYCPDLENKTYELLKYLDIPFTQIKLEKENVSNIKEEILLDNEDTEWIKQHYSDDFELWNKVNNSPESFKKVF